VRRWNDQTNDKMSLCIILIYNKNKMTEPTELTEKDKLLLEWGRIEFEMDQLRMAERKKFRDLVAEKEKVIFKLYNLIGKSRI